MVTIPGSKIDRALSDLNDLILNNAREFPDALDIVIDRYRLSERQVVSLKNEYDTQESPTRYSGFYETEQDTRLSVISKGDFYLRFDSYGYVVWVGLNDSPTVVSAHVAMGICKLVPGSYWSALSDM